MHTLKKLVAGAAIASALAVTPLAAAPSFASTTVASTVSHSQVKTKFIPEWYQYCYNIRPIGITSGQSGYINAYKENSGVTCKWWVMPWRAGFPHTVQKYYTWDTVCRSYGTSYSGMSRGLPWCR
ncbi:MULTISPECIES: hypothetical protein [unclassified Leifsonia]|jgi:hypothetical protein|uniref:hypothetical protein n=1 Tax=unclassified Leifsonia TaxID=2663824 RepID=UPI00036678A5|nr:MULTISPECIES: hypothetical protein [unclassified Leifsonia]TDP98477.1 hypothetical protein AXZ95_2375 [Leifsonia sp. 115AMFTsu3.1]